MDRWFGNKTSGLQSLQPPQPLASPPDTA